MSKSETTPDQQMESGRNDPLRSCPAVSSFHSFLFLNLFWISDFEFRISL